ncbi:hypothetical protein [Crenothrix polyspora]|uniref:Uncharacterized protein n=1 Tax=Crenothrix polyspora TaxID=360316 RepID=A0A1R4H8X6_9GAMM|nr:hypothetical protein [Crenothrix polyspora]SJM92704.1 conserved hypothetical protein [Crenothrix polyspora]
MNHKPFDKLRYKGERMPNLKRVAIDPGFGDKTTTGELALGVTERYLANVRLFGKESVMTNVGILHESGHWIIAMDCLPTRTTVLDYGSR